MGTVSPLPTRTVDSSPSTGWPMRVLKRAVLLIALVCVGPLVLLARAEAALGGPGRDRAYTFAKELLSPVPTLVGSYLRLAFYWASCRDVSPEAAFLMGSMLSRREVSVGPGTVVGAWSVLGRVEIGRDVMIASRVSVFSDRYLHGRPADRAEGNATEREAGLVRIGDGCWIGENAVVMASLGPRCTVAAGAVVFRAAPAGCTLMGNPARKASL